jgi:hypothetical protein
VRPPHPAVARRALLTLLFLGGFLVLAFVFGGSAQAASGTGQDGREASGAATSGLLKPGEPSGSTSGSTSHKADKDLTRAELAERQRLAARQAAERAASQVTGPVAEGGDRAQEVTRPIGEAVEDATGPGGLGELPGHLGLGDLGDGIAGDGSGGGSGHGADADCTPGATGTEAGDHANGPRTQGGWSSRSAGALPGAAADMMTGDGIPGGGDGDPADGLPFHGTPAVPAPTTSQQYAGDSQGQRGGPHQQAAVITGTRHFAPLQPGAVRAADGAPTRDSAGDVLEFPG